MAYHRFDLSNLGQAAATVAAIATVSAPEGRSNVPGIAVPVRRERRTVANAASVAAGIGDFGAAPDPMCLAVLVEEGGVPLVYAEAFADLMAHRPPDVTDARWCRAIDDAGYFLDRWGTTAAALGWTGADLFARAERGAHGLAWELDGREVIALSETTAVLGENATTLRAWYARPVGRCADVATA